MVLLAGSDRIDPAYNKTLVDSWKTDVKLLGLPLLLLRDKLY